MTSYGHISIAHAPKPFAKSFVYKLVLAFAQFLVFSSELTWLMLVDKTSILSLFLMQNVKALLGTLYSLKIHFSLERLSNPWSTRYFSLIVKTIFFCIGETIVARRNRSVKTVYNLQVIKTILTFTFHQLSFGNIFVFYITISRNILRWKVLQYVMNLSMIANNERFFIFAGIFGNLTWLKY